MEGSLMHVESTGQRIVSELIGRRFLKEAQADAPPTV